MSDRRAISFVEVAPDGQFRINEEAVEFIESLPQPLSIIACAGAYRTGKSLFLNRGLLQVEPGQGFAVGSTTNACTKGLWIHTSLIQVARKTTLAENSAEKEYTNVLIIDTEGLGAFDANDSHDTKIFALALLLCSYFIYNSVGKIDEDAIGRLSLVCNVCKQVRASAATATATAASEDTAEEEEEKSGKRRRVETPSLLDCAAELSDFFPQFLWLLRDFSLVLEDSSGASITARQYLENALADKTVRVAVATVAGVETDSEFRKSIEEKNQLRRMLRQLFVHRDCATLMRPCIDETQLQKLDTLGDKALRPEFLKQLTLLRKKVFHDAPHKLALAGKPVSGRGLVQLARSYLDAFNRGAAPVIRDSWNLLVEVQCRDAIDDAKTAFLTSLATLLQRCNETEDQFHGLTRVQLDSTVRSIVDGQDFKLELMPQSLEDLLQQAFASGVEKFNSLCGAGGGDNFQRRLAEDLEAMCVRVRVCNARNLEKSLEQALNDAERIAFPQLIDECRKQLETALADTSLLSLFSFKPLWRAYCNLVDDSLQKKMDTATLGATKDVTMRNIVQRLSAKRFESWVMRLEEHWIATMKRLCEFALTISNRTELLLTETHEKLETLREKCDNLQQQQRVGDVALETERKINADQRVAFDVSMQKREAEHETELAQCMGERLLVEKEWDEFRDKADKDVSKIQQLLSQSKAELASEAMQRTSAQANVDALEQRCAQMSTQMDQMHDETETLRERLKVADQTVSRLRTCEAELQQVRSELARVANEYGSQLAQLERDSVASLAKIRATNERTRKEQDERHTNLQQQYEHLQTTSAEARRSLEAQAATLTEKLVQVRHEAGAAAERAAQDIAQVRERVQAAEQSLLDAQEHHKRLLQDRSAKYEAEAKQIATATREEAKRAAADRAELQRQLNEATTDAACQRVRLEHLQSKLQDEASRGELQQAKKDFERAALLNDKLRLENEKLLGQQRAHQHELQERERRIEQMQKKMQEQEREFSAERLRLRLRIEEENAQQAQQAYRKSLDDSTTTPTAINVNKKKF